MVKKLIFEIRTNDGRQIKVKANEIIEFQRSADSGNERIRKN
jgi:hypothetical protein